MSLGLAINNASSGLNANARAVQLVSNNVANALTEGYSPQTMHRTAAHPGLTGGGVRVSAVTREIDPALAGLLRQSGGASQAAQTVAEFWTRFETAVGAPGQAGSLGTLSARFVAALTDAAARPDLENRLASVQGAAQALVSRLNTLGREVQAQRQAAETAIARDVADLNTGLGQVAQLNDDILRLGAAGQDVLTLMDQRDGVIERLSRIVPLQAFAQQDGRVGLYSAQGAMLLGHKPALVTFTPKPDITAGDSAHSGQLEMLHLNGLALPSGPDGPLGGGRLGALFSLRDTFAPQAQQALDQIALDLATRLQAPGVDPGLPMGAAGPITDAGQPVDPLPPPGLAGRLQLNPGLDDRRAWRDGLHAPPGPPGRADQLLRFVAALTDADPQGRSQSEALGVSMAMISHTRQGAEDTAVMAQTRHSALEDARRANGVNTDEQMQRLLAFEKAYSANVRVLQVVDDLLRRLMEL
jgi:flagellar hook-associated protein 1 FlgK